MRSMLLSFAAVALAVFGVGKAFEDAPGLLHAALHAPPPATAQTHAEPPARAPLPVVHVDAALFRDIQQRQSSTHEGVVLDLERLESLEAAEALAQSWSDNRPAGTPLVCWLAATDPRQAAAAADVLARVGCTELRVVA